jgi:simple sugar transport system ATP-binding protein
VSEFSRAQVHETHRLKDVTVSIDVELVDERCDREDHRATALDHLWAPDDVLRVARVAKRFGEVVALRDVSLHLRRGEALGLVGDNASGKSTLIKVVCGFHRPDGGRVVVQGAPVALKSVDHARSLGIECVYQDLALIDQLSVWENMFLRRETVHWPVPLLARRRMRAWARRVLEDVGVPLSSVDVPVGCLSGGQRQAVAHSVERCPLGGGPAHPC